MNANSPCIGVCKLDHCNICIGCNRTKDEIARWTLMTDNEKAQVNALVAKRLVAWAMWRREVPGARIRGRT